MRYAASIAILLAVMVPGNPSAAADPTAFIAGLRDQLQVVHNVPNEQRASQLRRLFDQDFDIPSIARFVFGRYWGSARPQQQKELIVAFENFLIAAYADRLSAYADSGNPPVVVGSTPMPDGALVSSKVVLGRNPTQGGRGASAASIRVDWRVTESGGTWKIVDVVIDGLSMALTERVEFADKIQRAGGQLSELLAALRGRMASTGP